MLLFSMTVPCYVIHLDETFPNHDALTEAGFSPVGFKGINARKDEHLEYPERVNGLCQSFCPKGIIGCGMSHVLLAQKLYDDGVPLALVVEDDAYPKPGFSESDLDSILREAPSDWEILKLHCDMYCKDGSSDVKMIDGSTGAYLINEKGIKKLKDTKVFYHIDFQMNASDIKVYKSSSNMFVTDEADSAIRGEKKKHWASIFLPKPTSGEKDTNDLFSYKLVRVPGTSIELSYGDIVTWVLVLVCFYIVVSRLGFPW